MTLIPEDRLSLINYRKERAYATILEAKDVAALRHWNLLANRLYYAVFYAQIALLISQGLNTFSHSGVKQLIGLHYVKTGLLTKDEGKLLGKLFSMRQTGDYEDHYDWEQEDVEPLIPKVEDLVNKIISLINET